MELNPTTGELILVGPHEIDAGLFCITALEQYHGYLPRPQTELAQSVEAKLMAAQQEIKDQGDTIRVQLTSEETQIVRSGAGNGVYSRQHQQKFKSLPGYAKDAVDEIAALEISKQ